MYPIILSSLLRFALEITFNSTSVLQFEQFCLLFAIRGGCIHSVRCLQPLYAANFLVRTYSQRHRQKLQSAALQYCIGSVTEPLQHSFVLRPAVAGCVGERQCVGNVCARCYHLAHNNLSRSGSRFLTHTRRETQPIEELTLALFSAVTAATALFLRHLWTLYQTNSGSGEQPTLMSERVGLLFLKLQPVTRQC